MGGAADVGRSTVTTAAETEEATIATKLCGACFEALPRLSFNRKQWMCRQ